jgi:hypothetical protein
MARDVLWVTMHSSQEGHRCVGMPGRQTDLRTVQQQRQEEEHRKRNVADPRHESLAPRHTLPSSQREVRRLVYRSQFLAHATTFCLSES